MTQDWLKAIEERDEFLPADTIQLIRAYKSAMKAIEEAPHPQGYCAKWSHHWREGWELENSKDCSCWKSKALAYDPTKEVN